MLDDKIKIKVLETTLNTCLSLMDIVNPIKGRSISLFQIDKNKGVIKLVASTSPQSKSYQRQGQSIYEGLIGHCFRKKSALYVGNLESPVFGNKYEHIGFSTQSELVYPVLSESGEILAAITVDSIEKGDFSDPKYIEMLNHISLLCRPILMENTSYKSPKPNVFISYAKEDSFIVDGLFTYLNNEIHMWKDDKKLKVGEEFESKIDEAIEDSDFAIVCLSSKSVGKIGFVQKEFKQILEYSKYRPFGVPFALPIKVDDCKIPKEFSKYQWLELGEDLKLFSEKLAEDIIYHFNVMQAETA